MRSAWSHDTVYALEPGSPVTGRLPATSTRARKPVAGTPTRGPRSRRRPAGTDAVPAGTNEPPEEPSRSAARLEEPCGH